jgi:hypothetical protein
LICNESPPEGLWVLELSQYDLGGRKKQQFMWIAYFMVASNTWAEGKETATLPERAVIIEQ